jgi:hypothetical protein
MRIFTQIILKIIKSKKMLAPKTVTYVRLAMQPAICNFFGIHSIRVLGVHGCVVVHGHVLYLPRGERTEISIGGKDERNGEPEAVE